MSYCSEISACSASPCASRPAGSVKRMISSVGTVKSMAQCRQGGVSAVLLALTIAHADYPAPEFSE